MMADQPEMVRRVAAAQAALDGWRDKPFRYGRRDCVRLTAAHLRRMGHAVRLPSSGSYASPRSARRELALRGFTSLAEAMDSFGFERIPPAAALPGDVLELPSTDEIGALAVALTNGRVVAYHQDAVGAVVLQPVEYVAAWRVSAERKSAPESSEATT